MAALWTYLEDADEVYIPAPNLIQRMFVPALATSNEPRRIEHNAQAGLVHGIVFPK